VPNGTRQKKNTGTITVSKQGEINMAYAVFAESYEPTMGSKKRQFLIVPHTTTLVYSRLTDGRRGPQNAWGLDNSFDPARLGEAVSTSEKLTREIVAIKVSETDIEAISSRGYSPVLNNKAMQAHDKAPATTNNDALTRIKEAYQMVNDQNPDLENFVIDGRKTTIQVVTQPEETSIEAVAHQVQNDKAHNLHSNSLQLHLASVPRKEIAQRYVHREISGGLREFVVFDYGRANHINTLIYGPTGPGKTTAVEAWASERELRLATVSGNAALEPGHLFGKYIPDGVGGFVWVDGPVTDVVRNGGVLLMDELNFISPKIYTVLYGLLDARRSIVLLDHYGEVIEAHEDFTVFATMNPEYSGTTPLNFAMRNRFDIQIPWDYDDKVESKLVPSKALRAMVKQLRDEAAKGTFETPISTNMLIEFREFVRDLGYDFAAENFVAHFAADEQASVRMVIQTHANNLKADLGVAKPVVVDKGDEKPVASTSGSLEDLLSAQIPRA
jgi:MoxR-like ATPase